MSIHLGEIRVGLASGNWILFMILLPGRLSGVMMDGKGFHVLRVRKQSL